MSYYLDYDSGELGDDEDTSSTESEEEWDELEYNLDVMHNIYEDIKDILDKKGEYDEIDKLEKNSVDIMNRSINSELDIINQLLDIHEFLLPYIKKLNNKNIINKYKNLLSINELRHMV